MLETIACYAIVAKKGTLHALAHLRAALSSTISMRNKSAYLPHLGLERFASAALRVLKTPTRARLARITRAFAGAAR